MDSKAHNGAETLRALHTQWSLWGEKSPQTVSERPIGPFPLPVHVRSAAKDRPALGISVHGTGGDVRTQDVSIDCFSALRNDGFPGTAARTSR
jgi:hypothetical protein